MSKKNKRKLRFPKAKNQNEEIKIHLEDFGSITAFEAVMDYGIYRLSSRIHILRNNFGMSIKTINKTRKNRYGNNVNYAKYELQG